MNPQRLSLFVAVLFTAPVLWGCNNGPAEVNDYLGQLENTVAEVEQMAASESYTLSDVDEASRITRVLQNQAEKLKDEFDFDTAWSDVQRKKYADLSGRMTEATAGLAQASYELPALSVTE
jgi:hypothetical protein